jgi:hypothetical protein
LAQTGVCIQWQGSDAQKFAIQDIEEGKFEKLGYQELYGERKEYYNQFPFPVF